jgi:hypothetical protein
VVAFIHDEVVVEVPADADLAGIKRQVDDILIGSMKEICPDVAVEVEGAVWRRWSKDRGDEIVLPRPSLSPPSERPPARA